MADAVEKLDIFIKPIESFLFQLALFTSALDNHLMQSEWLMFRG
jgi:hypothetical protein